MSSQSRTVLVFDSDEVRRVALSAALREAGHGVLATGDGEEATELTEEWRLDLAVIEWIHANLEGLEVACRVKSGASWVPVVWLGEMAEADEIRSFIRNTDGFVCSPVNVGDFVALVEVLLEAKVEQEQLASRSGARLAATDSVTGLYNTQYLARRLGEEVGRGQRQGTPVAMLLVDVDDFRKVNARVGFASGNEVLRQLGERLRAALRGVDALCRIGPDEFAAVLPFTDDVGAVIAAERLREEVQVHRFELGGQDDVEPVRLTLSIGVAASTLLGYDAEALTRLADEAVAAAKTSKNRVVLGGH